MNEAENFSDSRTGKIMEYIKNNYISITMQEFYDNTYTAEELTDKIFHFTNGLYGNNTYAVYDKENNSFSYYEIFDVDVTRPWIIKEEEGSEYIMYLDLVNKEKNFYGFIDD